MNEGYDRNLDLNLLRVFVVVADAGSVTQAARRLYLTQPAVSAALRRLIDAVGAPLFTRHGRGLSLTARGERLAQRARPLLTSLVEATLSSPTFDPATSERVFRIGLSDSSEGWLLPPLLRAFEKQAPHMRIVVLPVQFRTVGLALSSQRIDAAVTVADELPSGVKRKPLFTGGFTCLFDPRRVRLGTAISERDYFAHTHVIVSYNGDLRGIVEDLVGKTRNVRCSVPSFDSLGAIVEGSALLATVPRMVARQITRARPRLRTAKLPFHLPGTAVELLWPAFADDDDAGRYLRQTIERVAMENTA